MKACEKRRESKRDRLTMTLTPPLLLLLLLLLLLPPLIPAPSTRRNDTDPNSSSLPSSRPQSHRVTQPIPSTHRSSLSIRLRVSNLMAFVAIRVILTSNNGTVYNIRVPSRGGYTRRYRLGNNSTHYVSQAWALQITRLDDNRSKSLNPLSTFPALALEGLLFEWESSPVYLTYRITTVEGDRIIYQNYLGVPW